MEWTTIVVAIIAAVSSFAGAALSSRRGFVELRTEFTIKQTETERRLQKLEDKVDQLIREGIK